ncbi:IRR1 [Candida jiufengensis]|uniref:IRR1 n=1 Tax=Candida jiufengensis TaxID=497108 RepID=UPI0022247CEF|nr:IRR1 [Candida jiufengensis]KAI5954383.1 IRR1 [Candida jiufengensis]
MATTRSKRTRKEVSYKDTSDNEEDNTHSTANSNQILENVATTTSKSTTKSNKRRKIQPTQPEEEFEENSLFLACSSEEVNITDLAQDWIESYEEESLPNLNNFTNLMNLILRSCGSLHLFQPHDLLNLDSAEQTADEITLVFSKQSTHKFAFKLVPVFKKNVVELFKNIIEMCHEKGILYGSDELMNYIITWITSLTNTSIRSLRYTATEIALVILLQLSTISQSINKNLERSKQHLIKNKQKSRAKTIQNTINTYENQLNKLDEYFDDLSEVIGNRYKDIDPAIRAIVVKELIDAMMEYPTYFCQSNYLKYCGWLLSDVNNNVRKEITKNLAKLFKINHTNEETIQNLTPFTQKFKSMIITMAQIDIDVQVRINCYGILIDMLKINLLDEQNKKQVVVGFPFESKSIKEINEASKFLKLYIDQEFNSTRGNAIILDHHSFKLDEIDLKDLLLIKTLITILQPIDDKELELIFKQMSELTNVTHIVKYLLADIDTITTSEEDPASEEDLENAKNLIELNEKEKLLLIKLIKATFYQNPSFVINNLSSIQKFISKSKDRLKNFIQLYPLITSCFKTFTSEQIDQYIDLLNENIQGLLSSEEYSNIEDNEEEYFKLIIQYLEFKSVGAVFVSYMNIPYLIQRQLLKYFIEKEKELSKLLKVELSKGDNIVGIDEESEDEQEQDEDIEVASDEENQDKSKEAQATDQVWELEKKFAIFYMKLMEVRTLLDAEFLERFNLNIDKFEVLSAIRSE